MATITVTVHGPVGSGKSAIAGEIEIALKAVGVPVRYANPAEEASEKNMTGADWTRYLEMYKPNVVLAETIERPAYVTIAPGVGIERGALFASPHVSWRHIDGPLMTWAGHLHWLTWCERIALCFGRVTIDEIAEKHWPDVWALRKTERKP